MAATFERLKSWTRCQGSASNSGQLRDTYCGARTFQSAAIDVVEGSLLIPKISPLGDWTLLRTGKSALRQLANAVHYISRPDLDPYKLRFATSFTINSRSPPRKPHPPHPRPSLQRRGSAPRQFSEFTGR